MSFSEHFFSKNKENQLKTIELSPEARMGFWNVFLSRVFGRVTLKRDGQIGEDYYVFLLLWKQFYKNPMDEYERDFAERKDWYRDQFEALESIRLFDLLEFVAKKMVVSDAGQFVAEVNTIFELENIPYRMLQHHIVPLEWTQTVSDVASSDECLRFYKFLKLEEHWDVILQNFIKLSEKDFEAFGQQVGQLAASLPELLPFECDAACEGILKQLQLIGHNCQDRADAEAALSVLAAAMRWVFQKAVAKNQIEPFEKQFIKAQRADPWGERK